MRFLFDLDWNVEKNNWRVQKIFFFFFLKQKPYFYSKRVQKNEPIVRGRGRGVGPKKSALNDQKWHNCHQYAISTKVPALRQQKCPLSPRKYPFCKKKCRFRPKSALSVQKKCPFSSLYSVTCPSEDWPCLPFGPSGTDVHEGPEMNFANFHHNCWGKKSNDRSHMDL